MSRPKVSPVPRYVSPVVRERWAALQRLGNGLRGLYGAPVFLCGSALDRNNDDPRDIDVRIMLSDAEFRRRYGDPIKWMTEGGTGRWTTVRWRWSDDCTKQSRKAWRETKLNIDIQVYPQFHADTLYAKKRRVRLDTRGAK
jgi:hypothetical protein